jgi:hypothetical protein
MRTALAALAAVVAACAVIPRLPARHPVTISVRASDWTPEHRARIAAVAEQLDAQVVEGDPGADVVLVRLPPPADGRCVEGGHASLGLGRAGAIPECAPGLELEVVLLQESLHALGCQHVCRWPGEAAYCSPVGYGRAALNPHVVYGRAEYGTDSARGQDDLTWQLTPLVVAEYSRALRALRDASHR